MKKIVLLFFVSALTLGSMVEVYAKSSSFSSSRSSSSSSRFSSSSSSPSRYESRSSNYNSSTSKPSYTASKPSKTTTYAKSSSSSSRPSSNSYSSSSRSSGSSRNSTSDNGSTVATVVAAGALTALAVQSTNASDDDSYDGPSAEELAVQAREEALAEKRRLAAVAEREALQAKAQAAETARIMAEKEAWLKMTPHERQAITIKKMWIAPCKEWMCQN